MKTNIQKTKIIIITWALGSESGTNVYHKQGEAEKFCKDLNDRKFKAIDEPSEIRFRNKVYKFGCMRIRKLRQVQAEYDVVKEKMAKLQEMKLTVSIRTETI